MMWDLYGRYRELQDCVGLCRHVQGVYITSTMKSRMENQINNERYTGFIRSV